MNTPCNRKQLGLSAAFALTLGFACSAAYAKDFGPSADRELWTDATRAQVWKNGYGECWHSGFGPPPSSVECDPKPVAQYVPPAPVQAPYVAPAPALAQAPYVAPVQVQPAPVFVPPERPRKKDRN